MKSLIVSAAALACLAGQALAEIPVLSVRAEPIDSLGGYVPRAVIPVYDSIAGPYAAFAAASGTIGFDDYTTTQPGPTMIMSQFKFVGGVAVAGNQARFNFYDSTGASLVNFFTVNLPSGGNFIWTITLGTPPDGDDSTFSINAAGRVEMVTATGINAQWFLTPTAPVVGSNNAAFGAGSALAPPRNQAFGINIPSPASLALLGLGGLVATRRRR